MLKKVAHVWELWEVESGRPMAWEGLCPATLSTCRFEKMIGGYYLGELVRLVLAHLARRGVLFGGCTSPALLTRGKILLEHVAEMEE